MIKNRLAKEALEWLRLTQAAMDYPWHSEHLFPPFCRACIDHVMQDQDLATQIQAEVLLDDKKRWERAGYKKEQP